MTVLVESCITHCDHLQVLTVRVQEDTYIQYMHGYTYAIRRRDSVDQALPSTATPVTPVPRCKWAKPVGHWTILLKEHKRALVSGNLAQSASAEHAAHESHAIYSHY